MTLEEGQRDGNGVKICRRDIQIFLGACIGQICAFLLAVTGTTSTKLANRGVSLPTTQSAINYLLLSAVYGGLFFASGKRQLSNKWYKYAALAVLDVEGNFFLVLAYRYTSITSITLLDCFTIPVVIVLSWWVLGARYGLGHWTGSLLCVTGLAVLLVTESPHGGSSGPAPVLGDALVLLGATMYGICNVFEEKFLGSAGRIEVMAMIGIFGAGISAIQAALLEHTAIASVQWSFQIGSGKSFCEFDEHDQMAVALIVAFSLALFAFASLVPVVLMWSGSAALSLSLLTSDLWAGLARVLFFGGFELRQALSFVASLILTASGLLVFTLSKDVYGGRQTMSGFHPLKEGVGDSSLHDQRSGELECLQEHPRHSNSGSTGAADVATR